MEKFKAIIIRFLRGRYGVDSLYYALVGLYAALLVLNLILRSEMVSLLTWFVIAEIVYRAFSRNIAKRQMENAKFLKFWNKAKGTYRLTVRRLKESKTHRFRRCPHCGIVLRLPNHKGSHTAKCPGCSEEFEVRIML